MEYKWCDKMAAKEEGQSIDWEDVGKCLQELIKRIELIEIHIGSYQWIKNKPEDRKGQEL